MIPRATTGPLDDLAATLVDLRSRTQTLEVIAHRHRFNLDPTPWTPVVFNAGWANAGVFGLSNCQYRRVGDVVQLRGTATGVAPAVIPGNIFNLPAGFRPPALLQFAVVSNNAFGVLNVYANGDVGVAVGALASVNITVSFSVTA